MNVFRGALTIAAISALLLVAARPSLAQTEIERMDRVRIDRWLYAL